jgi:hypothetical protein
MVSAFFSSWNGKKIDKENYKIATHWSKVGFKRLANKDIIILGTIVTGLHVHCTCTITSYYYSWTKFDLKIIWIWKFPIIKLCGLKKFQFKSYSSLKMYQFKNYSDLKLFQFENISNLKYVLVLNYNLKNNY